MPGSRADDVMGYWQVEAGGPPGYLRVVAFYPTEDDDGLDVAAPIVGLPSAFRAVAAWVVPPPLLRYSAFAFVSSSLAYSLFSSAFF